MLLAVLVQRDSTKPRTVQSVPGTDRQYLGVGLCPKVNVYIHIYTIHTYMRTRRGQEIQRITTNKEMLRQRRRRSHSKFYSKSTPTYNLPTLVTSKARTCKSP